MKKSSSGSKSRLASFRYAFQGVTTLLRTQPNFRIHLLAAIVVCGAAVYFDLTETEWCVLIITISLVWFAEAINSAIEFICDATMPKPNALIGKAKDVAAAAVLFTAIGAVIVGLIIFGPCVADLFKR